MKHSLILVLSDPSTTIRSNEHFLNILWKHLVMLSQIIWEEEKQPVNLCYLEVVQISTGIQQLIICNRL